jgi:hypothetical protein
VHADMDLGVGPVDELSVHPDLFGLLHHALLWLPLRFVRILAVSRQVH